MSLSLWDYVRRRSCEAVLAGVQDALDQMERLDQSQSIHAAAKTLRRKLHDACGNGGNNSKAESQPLFEKPAPEVRPPANIAPAPAPAVPAQPQQLDNNIRRPPGRPRKETHG